MTVLQLKCFLAVCETKKYSLAAQQLGMTQSVLSKQLKALEEEFSINLFCWDNKRLQLTEAGNVLYPHAVYVLGEYKKMLRELHTHSKIKNDDLALGSMYFTRQYHIIQMIEEFAKIQPQISVSVGEYRSNELEELMKDSQLDACFVYQEILNGNYSEVIPLKKDSLCVVMNRNHPFAHRESVRLSELKEEQFILLQGDKGLHKQMQKFCIEEGFVPREHHMDVRNETIKEMILFNNWVSLFMEAMADDLLDEHLVKVPVEEKKRLTLALVMANDRGACRTFANFAANF